MQIDNVTIQVKRNDTEFKNNNTSKTTIDEKCAIDEPETQKISKTNTVTAPIAGVFYAAREPGSQPFVSKGHYVKKGDTLCYLEAMKMMMMLKG